MKNSFYCAVITGDIVESSRLKTDERTLMLGHLKSSFRSVEELFHDSILSPFEIYRGDGFQGVLADPRIALHACVLLRAMLRCGIATRQGERIQMDARIVVGIGAIDSLPGGRGHEGDGEAFRRSGPHLDRMKGDARLSIHTPSHEINKELEVECALLDTIIAKWSPAQAEAIICQIRGLTQKKAAGELGISQPAVRHRLKTAGGWAILKLLHRYSHLMHVALPGHEGVSLTKIHFSHLTG